MDKRLSNKASMYESVYAYLSEHEIMFVSIAGMMESKQNLQQKIEELLQKDNLRNNVAKGKKQTKETTRDRMTTYGLTFAAKLYDYAKKNGNGELVAQSDYSRSVMKRMRDSELINTFETIKNNVAANLQALSAYGITQEKVDTYNTGFENYKIAIDSKLSSDAIKISANKTLLTLMKETDNLIKSIDKMMEEFHDTESQFYLGYKAARSIKDFGLRRRHSEGRKNGTVEIPAKAEAGL